MTQPFFIRPSPNHACTLSMHVAFQTVSRIAAIGSSSVVASVHLARLPAKLPTILRSFALYWTFSSSDYYDRSVSVSVAAGRRSRVPLSAHVRASRR
jgi:hypothetical protein